MNVKQLYMASYDMGMKGVTYMRDGSREGVLSRIEEKPKTEEKDGQTVLHVPLVVANPVLPRPERLDGVTYRTESPMGKVYITINHDGNREPFEVFITIGKSGSDVTAMADALGRMISLNLRLAGGLTARERIREVVAHLAGIGGARSVGFGENKVRSLPDAIAKVLSRHFQFRVNGVVEDKAGFKTPIVADGATNGHAQANGMSLANGTAHTEELKETPVVQESLMAQASRTSTSLFDLCPECGSGSLAYEEGCRKCYGCGYAEC